MLFSSFLLGVVCAFSAYAGTTPKVKNVIIQLFEWPWNSIASECTTVIGPAGYGYVQVSPAYEHIKGNMWWSDYQPVSYELISKRGTRDQYANMVKTCKAAGVDVLADTVLNHMTMATGTATGFGSTTYSKYDYPGVPYVASQFHYGNGDGTACTITGNGTYAELQNCELGGLADLAQEQQGVRNTLAAHLNDMLSLGVAGFRFDSARLVASADLSAIFSLLKFPYYGIMEIIYGDGENDSLSGNYAAFGDVTEFRATTAIMNHFLGQGISNLVTPTPMGEAWGYLPSESANLLMANQDTERSGTSLNVKSPNNGYTLSALFILAFNYGVPTIFSGYDYGEYSDPAPQDSAGNTNPVTCFSNGWRCEHRWMAIQNMVGFHNAAGSSPLTNVFSGNSQRIAFGRGSVAFIIINNDGSTWTSSFTTSLPDGNYCDIIHANFANCNAATYTISGGRFTASIGARDAIAFYVRR
ncbi:glycoside hydrolase superfamily [Collybia nuda]|uniref:Alpha-amylase n=1 Tax=Collybia nuda TaxID=64659 RepID=A0A9P6CGQ8_9AGAR|nr:glycoside hydrolase superfamily [Collybia nuda]